MNLLIDAGNSRIKWAFCDSDGGPALEAGLMGHAAYGKPEERVDTLNEVMQTRWGAFPVPQRVLVSKPTIRSLHP